MDEGHQQDLFQQRLFQGVDGPIDQVAPVVGGDQGNPGRQHLVQHGQLCLDSADHLLGVFAGAHDHDPADDFALAVLVEHAAATAAADLHHPQVLHADRHPRDRGGDHDILDIPLAPQIARAPHLVLCPVFFHDIPADVAVGEGYGADNRLDRHPVGKQFHRVQVNLVLLDEPTHRRHFGHPWDGFQGRAQVPVLERPQFGQVVGFALQDVPVDMPDPGAVGTEDGSDAPRQTIRQLREALQHPGPRLVEINTILKDEIDHGGAEHRRGADRPDVRQPLEVVRQRSSDLILDNFRGAPFPQRVDDHLIVRKVRDGVHRRSEERQTTEPQEQQGAEQRQRAVPETRRNNPGDHGRGPSAGAPAGRACTWLSASIRNPPEAATASPPASPETTS